MTRQNSAANRAEDADGVAFVRVGLALSTAPTAHATSATIALYAGMTAAELQSILRATLHLAPSTVCAGFAVPLAMQETPRRHAKGKQASTTSGSMRERIVPLTVACVSPSVLHTPTGFARVLISSPFPSTSAVKGNATAATQRLQRLVAALKDEDKSVSSFEAAVLAEICQQQVEQVFTVVQNPQQSLASKKQFLLSLVRRGNGAQPTAVAHVQRPSSIGDAAGVAQVDLICKKVVAIAHTVFSPHVQSDLMTEASLFREKQRKAKVVRGPQQSGSVSTLADGSVSSMMELLGVVERLLNKHALQEEQSVKLIRLILGENRLLFSALQSYKTDYNLNELENTVKRMAALSSGPASSPTAADIPAAEAGLGSPSKKKAKVAKKERQGFVVRPHDILHTLYHKAMITTLELDLLRALVNQQDAQVLASVAEYERTRSLEILRNQLVAIVDEITLELGDEEKMGNGQYRAGRAVDDMDEDDQEGVTIDHWQEQLIQFVQRMFGLRKLTADHVHVLRALIEEDHNLLQSAFEVFASDGDENELLDTLQRIAKLQLQANEGALVSAFNQIVDEHCEVLRTTEKKLVKQLFARKNELARAAWEVYEVEQNLEDFGDTLLRIARFATRQDSKLRLVEVVGEMMKRELIASHEADGLIRLYEEKNEAMVAANEAFESDGDVKEVVETLLLIVKHANFGAAPRCSSPRNASSGAPRSPRPTMTPPSSPVSDAGMASTETFFAARLIEILGSKGRLATWQMEQLLQQLAKGDARIFAAMDVYNEERDARELVDTLWRLCDLTAWEQNKSKIISQWIRPLERDGQVMPKGVLEKLVQSRDDRLIAAFVVFLGDNNGAEFADTLVRLARLEGLKQESTQAEPASDDEKQEMQLILARLANDAGEYGLSAEDVSAVESLVKGHDAKTLAAFDVYRENLDGPDFVDTLKRILSKETHLKSPRSPGSRASAMEKQLLHFVSELSDLTANEIAALKQSIARKDVVIEGAVEVYEADKDEDDLKDTLKRVAIHLASKTAA